MDNLELENEWEIKKEKALITFYSSLILEDGKIDVFSYMRCYSYVKNLPSQDRKEHAKALLTARENLELKISQKKLVK